MKLSWKDGWTWDIEGNGLGHECTTIWYIRLTSNDRTKTKQIHPFRIGKEKAKQEFMEWVVDFPDGVIVGAHNQLGYDAWQIWKLLDITPTVGKGGKDYIESKPIQFVDTYYLSMFLEPDLQGHSLEAHGERLGNRKIDYRQKLIDEGVMVGNEPKGFEFSFYHPFMDVYCTQDVDTNIDVLRHLWDKAVRLYGEGWVHPSFRMGQKSFFLMNAQAYTGVKFNKVLALETKGKIEGLMKEIEESVLPQLPPRALKKGEQKEYSMPAKPYKKDGTYSSHMLNFIAKHKGVEKPGGIVEFYGKDYKVSSGLLLDVKVPMELKDQDAFKDWLIEQGWQPEFYNFQKDSNGKAVRDPKTNKLILTSPKLQEGGKLDPGLELLDGPLVKEVVRYLSLRNRLGTLEGWLENPRLDFDGRLSASASGITSTHRQKHVCVCNVPKVGSLMGEEFRSLFMAEDGMAFVGADSAALENRVTSSYTWKYDNGAYADIVLNGDSHSHNAKAFFPMETRDFDVTATDFDKDNPKFKPYRNKAKNGLYCLLYGGQAPKLAKTLGIPENKGKQAYEAFWDANPSLKQFRDNVTKYWETKGNKTYLPAIDGRMLGSRSRHSLVNLLCQSAGAIATDLALIYFDNAMGGLLLDKFGRPYYNYKGFVVRRVLYQHDEIQCETSPEVAEEVGQIFVQCIKKAGKYLKMNVELDGEYKVADNWMGTH